MSTTSTLTNIQGWFRDHSDYLDVSFKSSERIKHNVSKGESRELQILDTLSKLLPTRFSVERNIVIVDVADVQSPKFDGALVDRIMWPRIFTVSGTPVAMIESVLAAMEVKSSLNKAELDDIFEKSISLRSMRYNVNNPAVTFRLVTAFAYECSNFNLSFFDFATSFICALDRSPSLICILNKGLFGLADVTAGKTTAVDEPHSGALPVLYHTNKDALLVYLYFLSRWAGMGTTAAQVFRQYSDSLFSSMRCFYFDADFLRTIAADKTAKDTARRCFLRRASSNIEDIYGAARKALDLSASRAQQ